MGVSVVLRVSRVCGCGSVVCGVCPSLCVCGVWLCRLCAAVSFDPFVFKLLLEATNRIDRRFSAGFNLGIDRRFYAGLNLGLNQNTLHRIPGSSIDHWDTLLSVLFYLGAANPLGVGVLSPRCRFPLTSK